MLKFIWIKSFTSLWPIIQVSICMYMCTSSQRAIHACMLICMSKLWQYMYMYNGAKFYDLFLLACSIKVHSHTYTYRNITYVLCTVYGSNNLKSAQYAYETTYIRKHINFVLKSMDPYVCKYIRNTKQMHIHIIECVMMKST